MRPQADRNSDDREAFWSAPPQSRSESQFALRLFGLAAGLFAAAALLAFVLARLVPVTRPVSGTFTVPIAFAVSTTFLVLCSIALQNALAAVRRERQLKFRKSLLYAIACGTLFVGVQTFGLWGIVQGLNTNRNAGEAQLGATALVLGAAALHALHVSVALMVLAYVTLQGFSDRYDHEYSFGVSVCTCFWHILGVLWGFILGAYGIVSWFLAIRL